MATREEYEVALRLVHEHEAAMLAEFQRKLQALLAEYQDVPGAKDLVADISNVGRTS
jgi:hypothetical protein